MDPACGLEQANSSSCRPDPVNGGAPYRLHIGGNCRRRPIPHPIRLPARRADPCTSADGRELLLRPRWGLRPSAAQPGYVIDAGLIDDDGGPGR
eukprot:scaffold2928_cov304-Prasinococcus_capsulatus_cf.AAC.2